MITPKLKIKTRPEDFIVEEVVDLPLIPKGQYAVYRLRKEGWNTVDALREIARTLRLPTSAFAYGGKKDRYGRTSQVVTLRDPRDRSFRDKHYSLEFLGYSFRAMDPFFIKANRFDLVVRQLKSSGLEAALAETDAVRRDGLPNYFDDQRFGSFDPTHGFLGEKILKQHWNGALRCALLSIHPQDKKHEKDRKRQLDLLWKDWKGCLANAKTKFERTAFEFMIERREDFPELLEQISREDLFMTVSAFQSHLWNEMVRRLLLGKNLAVRSFPGAAGDYLFYDRIPHKYSRWLRPLILPLAGIDARFTDPTAEEIYCRIMNEHGITPAMLKKVRVRGAQFKATPRPVILVPEKLTAAAGKDELYPSFEKLTLSFTLPRGSYATMVLKRLFSAPVRAVHPLP